MRPLLKLVLVGLTLAGSCSAASAFTITFDEAGNCTGCTSETVEADPTGTYKGNVLVYGLPTTVNSGAVSIFDSTHAISDTLYFTNNASMIFYSYDNGGLAADVGTTVLFPNAFAGPTEDSNGNFTYLASSGNIYNGTSGVSPVPLPGALPLFATGLSALGLLGWRRKKKQPA
jgi:hypothetical protein